MPGELSIKIIRAVLPRKFRNSLRRPSVTIQRCLAHFLYFVGYKSKITLFENFEIRCHPICAGQFEEFKNDDEQRYELAAFASTFKHAANCFFIDVGAHWGTFTLTALKLGCRSVICIEPSPDAAHILNVNLSLNGYTSAVEVKNVACGNHNGFINMLTTGAGGADYFVIPLQPRNDTVQVPVISLDSLRMNIQKLTHLKIDVEGFEESVLLGAATILKAFQPVIFLELHGTMIQQRGEDPRKVLQLLETFGYDDWTDVQGVKLTTETIANRLFNIRMIAKKTS